jgi:hypothetical protein
MNKLTACTHGSRQLELERRVRPDKQTVVRNFRMDVRLLLLRRGIKRPLTVAYFNSALNFLQVIQKLFREKICKMIFFS